jgi:hypothetical protein
LNPLGSCPSHPRLREQTGRMADHPKLPARPRMSLVFTRLFGSGFAGLGDPKASSTLLPAGCCCDRPRGNVTRLFRRYSLLATDPPYAETRRCARRGRSLAGGSRGVSIPPSPLTLDIRQPVRFAAAGGLAISRLPGRGISGCRFRTTPPTGRFRRRADYSSLPFIDLVIAPDQLAVLPPLTRMIWPVMNRALLEARKLIASATSSDVPARFRGMAA